MDCIKGMKQLEENSIDAIVTDPPYGLEFMGKDWDRLSGGFSDGEFKGFRLPKTSGGNRNVKCPECGKWIYDHHPRECRCGGVERLKSLKQKEFHYLWAIEALRVLKPGGHLLSFGGTRTYHRMAVAIEDAGFEIRDMIEWVYGSGFPKSHNIGKSVDKLQGNEREVVGKTSVCGTFKQEYQIKQGYRPENNLGGYAGERDGANITKGISEWEGWGTALKPAHEPICMARKPLSEKTVAENVLKYGTGGINIDGSRVEGEIKQQVGGWHHEHTINDDGWNGGEQGQKQPQGRFPANLIHDNSEEVRDCFPETKGDNANRKPRISGKAVNTFGMGEGHITPEHTRIDSGNASRFFKSIIYQAKASKSERNFGCEGLEEKEVYRQGHGNKENDDVTKRFRTNMQNNHPTVKPIALMEYLIKMVTRQGGIVLDPFMGSGTTSVACRLSNRRFIGFEINKEYVDIANKRLANVPKNLENWIE